MPQAKFIVCDLDGTLFNEDHRVHLGIGGDWENYFSLMHEDTPHDDVLITIRAMTGPTQALLLTGRPEKLRCATEAMLAGIGVPYTQLLMRPDGDTTDSGLLKISTLEKFFGSKAAVLSNVLFALEDRDKIVKAFRDYGINCWQVRAGRY